MTEAGEAIVEVSLHYSGQLRSQRYFNHPENHDHISVYFSSSNKKVFLLYFYHIKYLKNMN